MFMNISGGNFTGVISGTDAHFSEGIAIGTTNPLAGAELHIYTKADNVDPNIIVQGAGVNAEARIDLYSNT